MRLRFLWLGLAGAIAACALPEKAPDRRYQLTETTVLIPESIRVSPRGNNWLIEAYAQNGDSRMSLRVYATSCDDRSGNLWLERPNSSIDQPVKAIWGSRTVVDKFFTAICTVGNPMVDRAMAAESGRPPPRQMSPQERAVLLQHILRGTLPSDSRQIETRCERVPGSPTGAVVCTQK